MGKSGEKTPLLQTPPMHSINKKNKNSPFVSWRLSNITTEAKLFPNVLRTLINNTTWLSSEVLFTLMMWLQKIKWKLQCYLVGPVCWVFTVTYYNKNKSCHHDVRWTDRKLIYWSVVLSCPPAPSVLQGPAGEMKTSLFQWLTASHVVPNCSSRYLSFLVVMSSSWRWWSTCLWASVTSNKGWIESENGQEHGEALISW